jgi:hypothetical protein
MLALVALFPVGLLGLLLLTSGLEGRVVRPGSDLVEAALSGLDEPDSPGAPGQPATRRKTRS